MLIEDNQYFATNAAKIIADISSILWNFSLISALKRCDKFLCKRDQQPIRKVFIAQVELPSVAEPLYAGATVGN